MKAGNRILVKNCIAVLVPFLFAGCGQGTPTASGGGPAVPGESSGSGNVRSTILLGKVGVLSKASTINLSKLVLSAVSSATPPDTVTDTSSVSGHEAVTVLRNLTLKPLRNWVISAKTLDLKDSVIHSGSTASFLVNPAETTSVSLNLASRFAMYQANFNTLPDSIASATGTSKDKLNLNRVLLKVDGVTIADSVLASGYFSGGQNVSVYFDYVTPGSHSVTLEAYGDLHSYSGILYQGASTFSVAAGNDDTRTLSLDWVGPTTGTGSLTVILGKVGQVIVNGTLPDTVL
ncbi:MAG TPA: hypothetical protein VJ385_21915 [Fibrobacteria bacterium]|nr:hypothetical protein [Fibrobacteria bacterium]